MAAERQQKEVTREEKKLNETLRLEQKRLAILQAQLQQLKLKKEIKEFK